MARGGSSLALSFTSSKDFVQYIPDQNASRARDAALQLPGLPTKSNIIVIRWPAVLIGCVLILLTTRATPLAPLLNAFAVLYALSNAGLYFVSEATFRELKFNVWLIGVDTLVLTASLIINGQVGPH